MSTVESPLPKPKPLSNFSGVACWWNSMLQFMMSITCIYDALKRTEADGNDLATAYIQFVENKIDNRSLFEVFVRVAPDLDRGQQCSREGFERFIDELKNKEVEYLLSVGIRKILACASCGGNNGVDIKDPTTRTNNTVAGYYFNPLITTKEQFTNFIRRHDYKMEWKCENADCAKFNITQVIDAADVLKRVNPVMCFHMNKYNLAKQLQFFPESFEIPMSNGAEIRVYKLVATTEHTGSVGGGHYQARGLRQSLRGLEMMWFNDSAAPIPTDRTPRTSTVMLAYVLYETIRKR